MADRVQTVCPCCETKLTVDTATGDILAEERPKKDLTKTFEDAMGNVRQGAGRREEVFSKAFDRQQRLDDVLEKKFEEARKKAEKDKSKPFNPFDGE
jgi:hypothetical protein